MAVQRSEGFAAWPFSIGNAYPREVLIASVLVYVEEVLARTAR